MITTQKTNNMEEKREQRKFEFTLYLNDNIIVQRFFNIIGFNNKLINVGKSRQKIIDVPNTKSYVPTY